LAKDGSQKHKWPATSGTSIQFGFIPSKTDWDHKVSIQIFDVGLVGEMSPLSPHSDASPDKNYKNQDDVSIPCWSGSGGESEDDGLLSDIGWLSVAHVDNTDQPKNIDALNQSLGCPTPQPMLSKPILPRCSMTCKHPKLSI
jgi:hypothetical protein